MAIRATLRWLTGNCERHFKDPLNAPDYQSALPSHHCATVSRATVWMNAGRGMIIVWRFEKPKGTVRNGETAKQFTENSVRSVNEYLMDETKETAAGSTVVSTLNSLKESWLFYLHLAQVFPAILPDRSSEARSMEIFVRWIVRIFVIVDAVFVTLLRSESRASYDGNYREYDSRIWILFLNEATGTVIRHEGGI